MGKNKVIFKNVHRTLYLYIIFIILSAMYECYARTYECR